MNDVEQKLEWHVKTKNPYRKLQRKMLLELCKGKKVLDIGGGTGRTAFALQKRGYDVTVLDMDPDLVEYGKKHHKGVKFVYGDARNIPLKEKFDEVILEHIIEHIKDQEKVISEVRKVLKKGGRLIISTPNKWMYRAFLFFGRIAVFKWNEVFLHVPDHISELNPGEFRRLLSPFEKVNLQGINPFLEKLSKKNPWIGIGLVAECKK